MLTPEEKKTRARESKRRSRSRQRQAVIVPTASDWADQFPKQHPALASELDQDAEKFAEAVLFELQINPPHNHFSTLCERCAVDACLDQVSRTLLGLKKGWVRNVQDPSGQLVAGTYFPDELGETIVQDAHLYGLERSQTFSAAYRELLTVLDWKYGEEKTGDARAIKAELEGSYVLPEPVEPKPEPQPDKVQVSPVSRPMHRF